MGQRDWTENWSWVPAWPLSPSSALSCQDQPVGSQGPPQHLGPALTPRGHPHGLLAPEGHWLRGQSRVSSFLQCTARPGTATTPPATAACAAPWARTSPNLARTTAWPVLATRAPTPTAPPTSATAKVGPCGHLQPHSHALWDPSSACVHLRMGTTAAATSPVREGVGVRGVCV